MGTRVARYELENVGTREDLDSLPVGSVVAYIGSEPDAPAISCKAADGGWQFMGEDSTRRRVSAEMAHPADANMRLDLRLLWDPRWDA